MKVKNFLLGKLCFWCFSLRFSLWRKHPPMVSSILRYEGNICGSITMTFGNLYKNNGGGRSEELTQSYGLYTGAQLTKDIQAYLDIQLFKGNGVGYGQGMGGYPNSLYIRAGSSQYIRHPGYDKNRGPLWA